MMRMITCRVVALLLVHAASHAQESPNSSQELQIWETKITAEENTWNGKTALEVPGFLSIPSQEKAVVQTIRHGSLQARISLLRSIGERGDASTRIIEEVFSQAKSNTPSIASQAMLALAKQGHDVEKKIVQELFEAMATQRDFEEVSQHFKTSGQKISFKSVEESLRNIATFGTALRLRDDLDVRAFISAAGKFLDTINSEGILTIDGLSVQSARSGSNWRQRDSIKDSNTHSIYRSFVEITRFVLKRTNSHALLDIATGSLTTSDAERAAAMISISQRNDLQLASKGISFEKLNLSKSRLLGIYGLNILLQARGSFSEDLNLFLRQSVEQSVRNTARLSELFARKLRHEPNRMMDVLSQRLRERNGQPASDYEQQIIFQSLAACIESNCLPRPDRNYEFRDINILRELFGGLPTAKRSILFSRIAEIVLSGEPRSFALAEKLMQITNGSDRVRHEILEKLNGSELMKKPFAAGTVFWMLARDNAALDQNAELTETFLQINKSTQLKTKNDENEIYDELLGDALQEIAKDRTVTSLTKYEPFMNPEEKSSNLRFLLEGLQLSLIERGDSEALRDLSKLTFRAPIGGKWRQGLCTSITKSKSAIVAKEVLAPLSEAEIRECEPKLWTALNANVYKDRLEALTSLAKQRKGFSFTGQLLIPETENDAERLIIAFQDDSLWDLKFHNKVAFDSVLGAIEVGSIHYPMVTLDGVSQCFRMSASDNLKRCETLLLLVSNETRATYLEKIFQEFISLEIHTTSKVISPPNEPSGDRIVNEKSRNYFKELVFRLLPDSKLVLEYCLERYLKRGPYSFLASERAYILAFDNSQVSAAKEVLASSFQSDRRDRSNLLELKNFAVHTGNDAYGILRELLDSGIEEDVTKLLSDLGEQLSSFSESDASKGTGGAPDHSGLFTKLPQFSPWPPSYSHSVRLGEEIAASGIEHTSDTIDQVIRRLRGSLSTIDSRFESGIFGVPSGFIVVTRVERFDKLGKPLEGSRRWLNDSEVAVPSSPFEFVEQLFRNPPGFSRVFGFLFTTEDSLPPSTKGIQPAPPPRSGLIELPHEIGIMRASEFKKYLLVFSYSRTAGQPPTLDTRLSAEIHARQSGLISFLAGQSGKSN